jgi:MFS family permease
MVYLLTGGPKMDKLSWNSSLKQKAYFIFFLAASFYLYEFVLQVAPSVMAEPMMKAFHVTAEGFGIISAFYFYAYAPMQMPAGILFDRYGPRKLMTAALILCSLGSFFFASTESMITASLGRFLIGIGSAFSFIGVLVLLSRWFPARYFAILAGVAQAMSSAGAIFGEMPLAKLIELTGWREASFILAGIGLLLSLLLWTCIRDYPDESTQKVPSSRIRDEGKRLLEIWKHSYTWYTGVYACAIWTPIAVFAVLWGVPFLQEKYQISVVHASGMCSMIWIGIGIGSPLLGWVSDRFFSRRLALGISSLLGLVATIMILYVDVSIPMMYLVLCVLGLGAGGQTVSFAVVKDNNPAHLVGTASGFNNLSVLIGGAIFQPLVGVFLQHNDQAQQFNGVWHYPITSYQSSLLVMPCCYLLSLLLVVFLLKESHPART